MAKGPITGKRRAELVKSVNQLVDVEGMSVDDACSMIGITPADYQAWSEGVVQPLDTLSVPAAPRRALQDPLVAENQRLWGLVDRLLERLERLATPRNRSHMLPTPTARRSAKPRKRKQGK